MNGRRIWMRLAMAVSNPTGLRVDRWLVGATGFSLINHFYARASGLEPHPCLLLTTRHHETRRARTVVLPFQRDGERWLVVGSHGGAPTDAVWAKNLRAHREVEIQIQRRRIRVDAHEAMGEARERVWKIVTIDGRYLPYQKAAHPRLIPVFVLEERGAGTPAL